MERGQYRRARAYGSSLRAESSKETAYRVFTAPPTALFTASVSALTETTA
jgi:hypothetical protein